MREYWVYELCAGKWRYIGMTSNLKKRLRFHRWAIAQHPEKPRLGNWHPALREYPDPQSWEMRVLSRPFETEDEAIAEEERLQREDWDNPGRVWEKCGNTNSDATKDKMREALSGRTFSDETKDKMREAQRGKTLSDETKDKMREAKRGENNPMYGKSGENNPNFGKKRSAETKDKMREAWVRRRAEKAARDLT